MYASFVIFISYCNILYSKPNIYTILPKNTDYGPHSRYVIATWRPTASQNAVGDRVSLDIDSVLIGNMLYARYQSAFTRAAFGSLNWVREAKNSEVGVWTLVLSPGNIQWKPINTYTPIPINVDNGRSELDDLKVLLHINLRHISFKHQAWFQAWGRMNEFHMLLTKVSVSHNSSWSQIIHFRSSIINVYWNRSV